jgi:hypothetical protein
MFLGCSAKWWFRHGAGLLDPKGGALVRGSVVHKVAEYCFRQRLGGVTIETEDQAAIYETIWDKQAEGAQFSKDEPADVVSVGARGNAGGAVFPKPQLEGSHTAIPQ